MDCLLLGQMHPVEGDLGKTTDSMISLLSAMDLGANSWEGSRQDLWHRGTSLPGPRSLCLVSRANTSKESKHDYAVPALSFPFWTMPGFSMNWLGMGSVFQHQSDTGEGIHGKVLLDTLDSGLHHPPPLRNLPSIKHCSLLGALIFLKAITSHFHSGVQHIRSGYAILLPFFPSYFPCRVVCLRQKTLTSHTVWAEQSPSSCQPPIYFVHCSEGFTDFDKTLLQEENLHIIN